MKTFEFLSPNADETIKLAGRLAQFLKKGDVLSLVGELGSGKTTFVKGLADGLKVKPLKVNSPTFVLLNIYEGKFPLFHFDLYRLEEPQEILRIGYDEFLYDEGVCVIEWADRLKDLTPKEHLLVKLMHRKKDERLLSFKAFGEHYAQIIRKLKNGV